MNPSVACKPLTHGLWVFTGILLGIALPVLVSQLALDFLEETPFTVTFGRPKFERDVTMHRTVRYPRAAEEELKQENDTLLLHHPHQRKIKFETDPEVLFREEEFDNGIRNTDSFVKRGNLKSLGSRKQLFTSVLTDARTVTEYGTAIHMTWGTTMSPIQFFLRMDTTDERFENTLSRTVILQDVQGETYGDDHFRQTIRHVCDPTTRDDFHWYMFIQDTIYVNTPVLTRLLDRLTSSDHLILGFNTDERKSCSHANGIVISHKALTKICRKLRRCDPISEKPVERKPTLMQCIEGYSGMTCMDSKLISPELGVAQRLPEQSHGTAAVMYSVEDVNQMYRTHLHFLEAKITQAKRKLSQLDQGLRAFPDPGRPKRDSINTSFMRIEPSIFSWLSNDTSSPFHQVIDDSGSVYPEACLTKNSYSLSSDETYIKSTEMAENQIRPPTKNMDRFSYQVLKPNVGLEYKFYYIQNLNAVANEETYVDEPKVYHVTTRFPYGNLKVDYKETKPLHTIYVVSAIPKDIKYIEYHARACQEVKNSGVDCSMLYFRTSSSLEDTKESSEFIMTNTEISSRVRLLDLECKVCKLKDKLNAISNKIEDSAIVAFVSDDAYINVDFLLRCQVNTLVGNRAYFPIPFAFFAKTSGVSSDGTDVHRDTGYWSRHDYTSFCAYQNDILQFTNTAASISDLHRLFLLSGLDVYRAVDTSIYKDGNPDLCNGSDVWNKDACREEIKYANLL